MKEKLIENWLDNASERSYQPVFVQLLTAQGYRVVHSTRHNVLEYGKDILAIAPNGRGCAYQLKGAPHGQKMGLNEFRRDIQPQLIQLMSQPVVFPGFPEGVHDSFLVSNGFFEEEVQRAVDDLNRGPYPSKTTLISRGELLTSCIQHGAQLWPSELDDTRALIELYVADGRDALPTRKLGHLLYNVLHLNAGQPEFRNQAELQRAISGAALLTGIATSHFAEAENHYAMAMAWTLFIVSALAAIPRHQQQVDAHISATIDLGRGATVGALIRLWREIQKHGNDPLVAGDWLTDDVIAPWRFCALQGVMSCLAVYDWQNPILTDDDREALNTWLKRRLANVRVWGESFAASFYPWNVWLQKNEASVWPDADARKVAELFITTNHPKSKSAFPNPYYSFEEITKARFLIDFEDREMFLREEFAGTSYMAELLLHSVARSNLKQDCVALWPDFTRLGIRRFVAEAPWHYCLLENETGVDETRIYEPTYEWAQLRRDAVAPSVTTPASLTAEPWLLAMWWQVAPYRLDTDAAHAFSNAVFPVWGT